MKRVAALCLAQPDLDVLQPGGTDAIPVSPVDVGRETESDVLDVFDIETAFRIFGQDSECEGDVDGL